MSMDTAETTEHAEKSILGQPCGLCGEVLFSIKYV